MTRSRIERAVARMTGESLSIIKRLGFNVALPAAGDCDDQPALPNVVDWDDLAHQRIALFPNRQRVGFFA
jgi:hypothetical protein